ncbi:hypothetical protein G9A89_008435 [Geosiphon pyriformis]|nr:hypothetical protein G9A89_008435 [Geosiphon pyriformis]
MNFILTSNINHNDKIYDYLACNAYNNNKAHSQMNASTATAGAEQTTTRTSPPLFKISDSLQKLAIEIIIFILENLDERDQLSLAMSCSWLYRVYRIHFYGFASPKWVPFLSDSGVGEFEDGFIAEGPPVANYRDGVLMDGVLYVPILGEDKPVCWLLDFKQWSIKWQRLDLKICFDTGKEYQPLQTTVATVNHPLIHLFGGQKFTGEPTDVFYELDPRNMVLRHLECQSEFMPSKRVSHSLSTIDSQHMALFGGRSMWAPDKIPQLNSKLGEPTRIKNSFYDTKDFYLFDFLEKKWYPYPEIYPQGLPYPRSGHSSLVIGSSLYVYGGQKIAAGSTSNSPQSEIHDDEDLWAFNFDDNHSHSDFTTQTNKPQPKNIKKSFIQHKWQKLFSPRISQSPSFGLDDDGNWKKTTGKVTGKRCGAAMFPIGKRLAILGGYEKDAWRNEDYSIEKPWEMCKLYFPNRRRWDHIRIDGIPEMECFAVSKDQTGRPESVFVMGRKKVEGDTNGRLIMGWIKDD